MHNILVHVFTFRHAREERLARRAGIVKTRRRVEKE